MTSSVDTSVKYYHSDMYDAPVLSGTAGSMIAVLDACLVNGFSLKTVTSIVVASGVATMIVSGSHAVEVDTVVLIAGATPTALNGEQKVKTVSGGTITFATSVSDQTATGNITFKLSPAGFEKKYSGTNKAVYKSLNVTSTGAHLRVSDTGTTLSRVVAYETMGTVDTGTNPFPTTAQISGGGYWSKSSAADSSARKWVVIANTTSFYISVLPSNDTNHVQQLHFFGDTNSIKVSGDAFSCAIHANSSDVSTSPNLSGDENLMYMEPNSTASTSCYVARSHTGLGGSLKMNRGFSSPLSIFNTMSGNVTSFPYPNTPDGGLYLTPLNLVDVVNKVFRARFPGGYAIPQQLPVSSFSIKDKIANVAGLSNKNLMFLGGTQLSYYTEGMFIDITGPWV